MRPRSVDEHAPASGEAALARFNDLAAADAERELLACCASRAWAAAVAAGRPYRSVAEAVAAGGARVRELGWDDVAEALAAHPRIGERPSGPGREAGWSRREQSGTAGASREVLEALREGNLAYERRFGHVYLVRASGRDADEMLAILNERLGNDEEAEREVVRRELAEITGLRLARLLGGPPGDGEEVTSG
ncbi:2-oxo-4-hydroxy-4-carboxy-5-ureidoimidazoline decarboxylase [Thermopolyspora sp. NPDC052614]|uniref:2-oxo-4-hydroxy-4-carboxy-5-ureidoimidazoline decarboxylase n=1 Tax=Thermopolyspora sp. NPDC052614 TaxID=3155682 RepID=UPI003439E33A